MLGLSSRSKCSIRSGSSWPRLPTAPLNCFVRRLEMLVKLKIESNRINMKNHPESVRNKSSPLDFSSFLSRRLTHELWTKKEICFLFQKRNHRSMIEEEKNGKFSFILPTANVRIFRHDSSYLLLARVWWSYSSINQSINWPTMEQFDTKRWNVLIILLLFFDQIWRRKSFVNDDMLDIDLGLIIICSSSSSFSSFTFGQQMILY